MILHAGPSQLTQQLGTCQGDLCHMVPWCRPGPAVDVPPTVVLVQPPPARRPDDPPSRCATRPARARAAAVHGVGSSTSRSVGSWVAQRRSARCCATRARRVPAGVGAEQMHVLKPYLDAVPRRTTSTRTPAQPAASPSRCARPRRSSRSSACGRRRVPAAPWPADRAAGAIVCAVERMSGLIAFGSADLTGETIEPERGSCRSSARSSATRAPPAPRVRWTSSTPASTAVPAAGWRAATCSTATATCRRRRAAAPLLARGHRRLRLAPLLLGGVRRQRRRSRSASSTVLEAAAARRIACAREERGVGRRRRGRRDEDLGHRGDGEGEPLPGALTRGRQRGEGAPRGAGAGSDSGPGTARARMQDWGCEWARIKSFATPPAEWRSCFVRRSRRNRPPASWRRVAHGANAAARRGAGRGFETRRLAARNPVIGLLLAATLGAVANWPYALASLRSSMAAVAVAAMPSPSLPAAPSPPPAPPVLPPAPSEPQYVVLGMAGCEAVRADQVVCRSCAALAATRHEVAAGLCRLGTADWRARCSTSATPRRRCAPACASSSRRTSACSVRRPRSPCFGRPWNGSSPNSTRGRCTLAARCIRLQPCCAAAMRAAGSSRSILSAPPRAPRPQRSLVRARRHTPHRLHGVPPKLAAAAAGDGAAVAAVADGIPAWEPQPPETLARWAAAARRQLEAGRGCPPRAF